MSESVYYLVASDSPIMETINQATAMHYKFSSAAKAFQTKYGAKSIITVNNYRVTGLIFEKDIPEGWRQQADELWYVPDARTKIGKAIKSEIQLLPRSYDSMVFSDMLGREEYTHFGARHLSWTTFGVYGDKVVLRVPLVCKVVPPGCTKLRMSEFHKIVEDHEDVKKEV